MTTTLRLGHPTVWDRLGQVLFIATAIAVVLYAGQPVFTNDAFWHVNTGDHLFRTLSFPTTDVFSYTTEGKEWVLHEWLSQVVFAGVHAVLGMHGLRILTAAMAGLCLWLCYRLFRRDLDHPMWGGLGVLLFVALGLARLQTRPTLFTIAGTLLLLTWLTRRPPVWRWRHGLYVTALVLIWVNLHSVGLIALPIYLAFLAGETLKSLLQLGREPDGVSWPPVRLGYLLRHWATFCACCAATLATPAGIGLYAFALQDKRDVMQYVTDEWARFNFVFSANESLSLEAYVAVLLVTALCTVTYLVVAVVLSRSENRMQSAAMPDPSRVLLLLVLFVGGLCARRFHWLHGVAALYCLTMLQQMYRAGQLTWLTPAGEPRRPRLRRLGRWASIAGLPVALVALLALLETRTMTVEGNPLHQALFTTQYHTRRVRSSFELDGVRFLRDTGLQGNCLSHYNSGGILSYHLFPEIKVFIDSRVDLYRRDVYLDYVAVRDGRPDQLEILDRYGTDIYYRHWELVPPVAPEAWIPVFQGPDGDVWLRRGARSEENLERCARYWAARGVQFSKADGLAVEPDSPPPAPPPAPAIEPAPAPTPPPRRDFAPLPDPGDPDADPEPLRRTRRTGQIGQPGRTER